ncbi:MAG: MlaD family protein [Gemmatimonadetes bacterium]|nr:MlaD family protein [Gemmatimonadota bacterium]
MRDPGLKDRGAEIKVGILVLVGLVTLVVGLYWISDTRIGRTTMRVLGVAADAGQITPDSKVFLRGVEVGNVDAVVLEPTRVVLQLTLYPGVDIAADTRGVIKPAGFLGAQMIDLVPGVGTPSLTEGDTIALGRSSDLMTLATTLGDETGVLLERLEAVLSERMVENLEASSESFTGAMRQLEELLASERDAIHGLLANMDRASAQLAELTASDELDRSLANLDTLSTRLAAASENFDQTSESLRTITSRLADGEGTLGKMMTEDTLYAGLTETLANLRAASEEIAMLTKDIRERPDRYLKDIKVSVF